MSLTLDTPRSLSRALPHRRLWHRLTDAVTRRLAANRLRRELDRMDAHMLADIGISRAQLSFDVDRWEKSGR